MPTDLPQHLALHPASQRPVFQLWSAILPGILPAERALILLTLAVGALAFGLSISLDQPVAWAAFMVSFAPSVGLVALGAYLRAVKDMPRTAMSTIATGIFVGFTGVVTILIYLRFPFDVPMIDSRLMQLDAHLFGYDWAAFTTAIAAYPTFGKMIGWIYGTSLLQLFAVIFVLGASGRILDLHRILVTGSLSLLMAVAFWWHWPSLGPSAYVTLPAQVEQSLGLVHGEAAGARMMAMARYGNDIITPDIIMGTIAFPSYHTVMMCLAVFFLQGSWCFWPMAVLNLGVLPSILSHGGHHLSDVLGGFGAFALAYLLACLLLPRRTATPMLET